MLHKHLAFLLVLIPAGYGYTQSPATLPVNEIIKLIPDKINKVYSQASGPKSKMIQVGILRYSLVERNFSNGKKKIKILLFDYSEAQIMYAQATKRFSTFTAIESDSLTCKPLEGINYFGWSTENHRSQISQILLGISDRFYLTVEGTCVPVEELEEVLEIINPERFSKLN
jgi:hypothetical protein